MKLHIPNALLRAIFTCFATLSLTYISSGEITGNYPAGSITYSQKLTNPQTLEAYQSVLFEDIEARGYGAAIEHRNNTFALSRNGNVSFNRNINTWTDGSGGAIYNSAAFTLNTNELVSFSENRADSGGAIYNGYTFELGKNGDVTFTGNTNNSSKNSYGGAICNASSSSTFTLRENGNVTFSGNTSAATTYTSYDSYSSYGGAIGNRNGTFTLSGNKDVLFRGNISSTSCDRSSSSYTFYAYGGAIYNSGSGATFTLGGNGNVTFSGNTCESSPTYSRARGGAIYNGYAAFSLSGNENVTFSGNTSSSNRSSCGGAIYNEGSSTSIIELCGNGDVTFSGNISTSSSSFGNSYGGAIYNGGHFTMSRNGNVLFEKNAEVSYGVYRLRSIYSEYSSSLNLSASEGKSILFKDSIYAANDTVNLNRDGTGDIIFTGVSTESDLREVKGNVDGTAAEILNSRTSEIATDATLYAGRLMVEDDAILKVKGLSVAQAASVIVRNGMLSLAYADVTTADGVEAAVLTGASLGESSLAGADAGHRGTVNGARIDLAEGANFTMQHLVLGATTRITDDPATLELDDVIAELELGVNATLRAEEVLQAGTTLVQNGAAEVTLTPGADATVLHYEATSFDSVTLSGSSLVLELGGVDVEMFNGANFIAISFTSGTGEAIFDSTLPVTLSVNGLCSEPGYTVQGADKATTMYFLAGKELAEATPEPSTTTLSLLALAALAARRKRK